MAAFRAFTNDPRQHADGITYFRNLDTVTQNYIVARMFAGDGHIHPLASRLHPIQRAEGVMRANSALRRALQDNEMTRPRSSEVIELPGDVRRQAIDTLSALSVWEADNALRQAGYENRLERPRADYEAMIEGLEGISPEVYQVYQQTLAQSVGMQAVDPITSARQWGIIEGRSRSHLQRGGIHHL